MQFSASFVVLILLAGVLPAAPPTVSREDAAFFETRVRPVLVRRCFDCHGPETDNEAGLKLDSLASLLTGGRSGPAIKLGNPDNSLLVLAIRHDPATPDMPPKSKLPLAEVADLAEWIRRGAPWPGQRAVRTRVLPATDPDAFPYDQAARDHWAFLAPQPVSPPDINLTRQIRSPIDRFLLVRLEAAGLRPAPETDRRSLIRRATFDLHGIPPTPDQVNAFLADNRPGAFARLIDRLLASPYYGQRYGRLWLDVVRYADSNGMDDNLYYADAWRYRDWVVDRFNNDWPFDRFLVEQIAGDLVPGTADEAASERHARVIATGFLTLGPKMLAEDDPTKQQMDIVDDQIDTLGRSALGLTLGCARCHDHKFDPVPTSDYYALAGIFKSTQVMLSFRVDSKWNARALGPASLEQQLSQLEGTIDRLDRILVLGNQQQMSPELRKSYSDELEAARTAYRAIPKAMAVNDGTGADLEIFLRGNHLTRGPRVPRRFPRIAAGFSQQPLAGPGSGRLELARWVGSDRNPLSARVLVNRIWQAHFGHGLVRSPDNFGHLGQRPDNQPLLDWLSLRFVADGWSIKQLHRRIMNSDAYRMSTIADAETRRKAGLSDPDNRLLWKMNRRRMHAEVLRDSLLALSGQLDETMGGQPIDARAFDNLSSKPRSTFGFDAPRRSVYLPVLRSAIYEVFQAFDFPDPAVPSGRRDETTVAPQALFLMNGRLVTEATRAMAVALQTEPTDTDRLARAYHLTLGRPPRQDEQRAWRTFLAGFDEPLSAWQSVCRVLVSSNEFVYIQ
ncbi:MAG: PSD1 and planctomycete cytochrome C domain-containing protein [Planctomycetota bacterium]|nr:PSD1 and planctomycete cytochrome C domain-containing protein [Planctomycetota bacterium]